MRTINMKTFVVLARMRHFGRAAEALNTTQPAVSSRIATLESELGHRLINRADRNFSLTPEGEQVLATFERILGEFDSMDARLRAGPAPQHPPLRIGAIDSVAATWMPPLIENLHKRYDGVKIELTVDGTLPLHKGLKKGHFDLIFGIQPLVDEGFRSFTACILQMVWAGSARLIDPSRIYSVAEIADLPIISFPRNSPPYQMIAPYFHDEQVLASKLTSCNSLYAIVNLLVDGFGVGAIPSVAIWREIKSGLLHPIHTAKRFPPMPIIGTYQASTDQDFIRAVVEQARQAAADFCASVEPGTAWLE